MTKRYVSKCCGVAVKGDIRYYQYVDDGVIEHRCTKCKQVCKVVEKESRNEP